MLRGVVVMQRRSFFAVVCGAFTSFFFPQKATPETVHARMAKKYGWDAETSARMAAFRSAWQAPDEDFCCCGRIDKARICHSCGNLVCSSSRMTCPRCHGKTEVSDLLYCTECLRLVHVPEIRQLWSAK